MFSLRNFVVSNVRKSHSIWKVTSSCIECHKSTTSHDPPMKSGVDLLRDPYLNKGFSFSAKERQDLKLKGLIPAFVDPVTDEKELSYQEKVSLERLNRIKDNFDKYDYLMRLYDTDRMHFFRLINKRPTELMPLIYTPTVGAACQNYSIVYHPGRGLFIPLTEFANIRTILKNWPQKDVRAIVVTDGERILGLGDLGAYGMGIPVGKLALCTGLAGIAPEHCLPITLDTGTNNKKFLEDPLYFGIRAKRAVGAEYDNFIQEFVESCVDVFGKDILIQFEDFANHNAFRFLQKYAPNYCMFNDDIQGTASVILSGILTAARKTERHLKDEKIVCFGAGESMLGFGHLVVETLKRRFNMSTEEAKQHLYLVDSRGLLVKGRSVGGISKEKEPFCRPEGTPELTSLLDVIKYSKCTALIGAAAKPNTFTDEILHTLAQQCKQPLVFALSNPTHMAECTAKQAYKATKGQCVFASGSPFEPLDLDAADVPPHTSTYRKPGQANNAYIFPGLVLAITALRIHPITDVDFITAAEAVSENVTDLDLRDGSLYPPLDKIRSVSYSIACQVGRVALEEGRCWLHRGHLKAEDIDEIVKKMASYPDPPDLSNLGKPYRK